MENKGKLILEEIIFQAHYYRLEERTVDRVMEMGVEGRIRN